MKDETVRNKITIELNSEEYKLLIKYADQDFRTLPEFVKVCFLADVRLRKKLEDEDKGRY